MFPYRRSMSSSFLNDDLQNLRRREFERCQKAASRTTTTLTVGYGDALHLYGVPTPEDYDLSKKGIHICVPSGARRPRVNGLIAHTWAGELEAQSCGDFQVVSPAVAWSQISMHTSPIRHIATGCMLMSRDSRRRVTDKKTIEEYVKNNPTFTGRRACLKALPHLVENTDSPAEAELIAFLSIHGVKGFIPNFEIILPNRQRRFIDFAMPSIKLGLEYQGAYHGGTSQMRDDANRLNQLTNEGWAIIQITALDMRSDDARIRILSIIERAITRQTLLFDMKRNL